MTFNSSGFELTDWRKQATPEFEKKFPGKISRKDLLKLIFIGSVLGIGGYAVVRIREPILSPKTLAEWIEQNPQAILEENTQLQVAQETSLLHHPLDRTSLDKNKPEICSLTMGSKLIIADNNEKLGTNYYNHHVRVRLSDNLSKYGWVFDKDLTPPLSEFDN